MVNTWCTLFYRSRLSTLSSGRWCSKQRTGRWDSLRPSSSSVCRSNQNNCRILASEPQIDLLDKLAHLAQITWWNAELRKRKKTKKTFWKKIFFTSNHLFNAMAASKLFKQSCQRRWQLRKLVRQIQPNLIKGDPETSILFREIFYFISLQQLHITDNWPIAKQHFQITSESTLLMTRRKSIWFSTSPNPQLVPLARMRTLASKRKHHTLAHPQALTSKSNATEKQALMAIKEGYIEQINWHLARNHLHLHEYT